MELEVGAITVNTVMLMPATPRRAAAQYSLDGTPMSRRDRTFSLLDITRPMLSKELRKLQHSTALVLMPVLRPIAARLKAAPELRAPELR
jgi:hypothetical protein